MTAWLALCLFHPWPLTDLYGAPLPFGAVARCGGLPGRVWPNPVAQFAVTADGRTLAVQCVGEPWIRVGPWPTGTPERQLPAPAERSAWTVSPDGTALALAQGRGISLTDLSTGRERWSWMTGEGEALAALTFAPDGLQLFAVGAGKELFCFEAATGALAWRRDLEQRGPRQVVAAGAHLAVAGVGWFQVWDAARPEILWEETGRGDLAFRVALAADGRQLATAATGAEPVRVWDAATGKRRWRFPRLTGECTGLAFSPNGQRLACAVRQGSAGALVLADLTLGVTVDLGPCHGQGLTFLPDGQTLAWADPRLGLIRPRLDRPESPLYFTPPTGPVTGLAFSPDGRTLASVAGAAHLWNAATGRLRSILPEGDSVRFLPDGQTLFLGSRHRQARFWDLTTRQAGDRLKDLAGGSDLVVAPGGRTALVLGTELTLWDLAGAKPRQRQIAGGPHWVRWACFTPDGARVVVHDWIKDELRVGPLPTDGGAWALTRLAAVRGGRTDHYFLAVPADGRAVIFADGNGRLDVRDLATGQPASPFAEPLSGTAWALSPNGRLLAQGDDTGTVRVWELATGALRTTFRAGPPTQAVTALAWDGTGRRLASSGADHGLLIWDFLALPFDGRPAPGGADVAALWEALASPDGPTAHRAVSRLVRAGPAGLTGLAERLAPVVPPGHLDRLTADLGDERFAVREAAARALRDLGEQAKEALAQAARQSPRAETRRRAEALLEELTRPPTTPERLRLLRAVEVVEVLGTPAARALLERWAAGAAGAVLTAEAARALARWRRREGRP